MLQSLGGIINTISTHSAREDGDTFNQITVTTTIYFNPLRPRGRRPRYANAPGRKCDFNPLRPRGRRHPLALEIEMVWDISTHSAREDGDCPEGQKGTNI